MLDIKNITEQSEEIYYTIDNGSTGGSGDWFSIKFGTILSAVMLLGGCAVILAIILRDSYVQYSQNKVIATNSPAGQGSSEIQAQNTQDQSSMIQLNNLTPLLSSNAAYKQYASNLPVIGETEEVNFAESSI
ncbi:hypothetical protein [Candidatus Tisiphia endosymbiont of Nemotelus uliginosus]|uniref:hypothetical protein n=1 Tax=Candidatus Tisiphia endosymbiont of Nemotelus uliginosus TaxID=3077926 RepID=UPI0035C90272